MKKTIPTGLLLLFTLPSFSQVAELETFRTNITRWIWYDQGKIDSIPRTDANTARLKKAAEASFLRFVLHPDSKSLDSLKAHAKQGGGSYYFDQYSYFFHEGRRILAQRTPENNTNYSITLYGLYDYDLPNFISISIQPFTAGGNNYVVYYYNTRLQGTYYIRDVKKNTIVYTGTGMTRTAPIQTFHKIDTSHVLLIEDLGDKGQRAFVLNTEKAGWRLIDAFKGKAFPDNATDFAKKTATGKRRNLWLAANESLIANYGSRYLTIAFDESTKTLSYLQLTDRSGNNTKKIEAKWQNNQFLIDDYYLGEHLNDQPMPMPM
ncbi:MAG: hypothetical protein ABW019_08500 [Chitinophagaceae bacterium]